MQASFLFKNIMNILLTILFSISFRVRLENFHQEFQKRWHWEHYF